MFEFQMLEQWPFSAVWFVTSLIFTSELSFYLISSSSGTFFSFRRLPSNVISKLFSPFLNKYKKYLKVTEFLPCFLFSFYESFELSGQTDGGLEEFFVLVIKLVIVFWVIKIKYIHYFCQLMTITLYFLFLILLIKVSSMTFQNLFISNQFLEYYLLTFFTKLFFIKLRT